MINEIDFHFSIALPGKAPFVADQVQREKESSSPQASPRKGQTSPKGGT